MPRTPRRRATPSKSVAAAACYFFLLLSRFPRRCSGFATYLLTGSGCYTELDPDEVIMNFNVLSLSEQRDKQELPTMNLAVNGYVPRPGAGGENGVVRLSHFPATLGLQVLPAAASSDTAERDAIADYQFVVDVVHPDDEEGGGGNAVAHPKMTASFERGSCDNRKRITGSKRDVVKLKVDLEGNDDAAIGGTTEEDTAISLVAGWAAGHEAVKLTPGLAIRRNPWTSALQRDCSRDALEVSTRARFTFVEAAVELRIVPYSAGIGTGDAFLVKLNGHSNIEALVLECQLCSFKSGGVGRVSCDGRRVVLDALFLGPNSIDDEEDESALWPVVEALDTGNTGSAAKRDEHRGHLKQRPITPENGNIATEPAVLGLYSLAKESALRRTKPAMLPLRRTATDRNSRLAADPVVKVPVDPQKRVDEQALLSERLAEQIQRQNVEKSGTAGSLPAFQVGADYFIGLAILLVAPVLVIQLCLQMSRGDKGKKK